MSVTRAELKDIQSLLTKKGRREQHRFLAEGIRLLEEAVRHRVRPELVLFSAHGTTERGKELVDQFAREKVRIEDVSAKQIEQVSDTEAPQGLVGMFRQPPQDLVELSTAGLRRYLLCENISDPGNLGTLYRSALAFGFEAVLTAGQSAEPFSPKVVRSSAGTIFGVRHGVDTIDSVISFSKRQQIDIVATGRAGAMTLAELRKTIGKRPVILAIGSEADGISPLLQRAAAYIVRIDHEPEVESLNAAVAGSILMKEIYSSWTENKR